MKRTFHFISFVNILIIFISSLSGCSFSNDNEVEWDAFTPVPFDGYVCGFEDTQTLIQIPAFLSNNIDDLPVENFTNISLVGEEAMLICEYLNLSELKYNSEYDYSLTTLAIQVNLPTAGEYSINEIRISFSDGTNIYKALGNITFSVIKPTKLEQTPPIFMTKLMINQVEYNSLKIAYTNNSTDTVEISSLSFPDSLYSDLSIKKYVDFELETPEDGLSIHPGETRTFAFAFETNQEYFAPVEVHYLYLLPFLNYNVNGDEMRMPSQTQATVVQPPFTTDYVLALLGETP